MPAKDELQISQMSTPKTEMLLLLLLLFLLFLHLAPNEMNIFHGLVAFVNADLSFINSQVHPELPRCCCRY